MIFNVIKWNNYVRKVYSLIKNHVTKRNEYLIVQIIDFIKYYQGSKLYLKLKKLLNLLNKILLKKENHTKLLMKLLTNTNYKMMDLNT